MTSAYVLQEPVPGTLHARPLGGGPDIPLNTRWRDVQLGVTKPDGSNTGTVAGIPLRTVTQEILSITEPNTVLENLDIHGRIIARAPGLIVRNCRIRGTATPNNLIEATRPGNSATFIDCTLIPDVPQLGVDAFLGGDCTFIRCEVAHVVDGWGVLTPVFGGIGDPAGPTGVSLLSCYFHDFLYWSPDPAHQGQPGAGNDNATHNDAVQVHGGYGAIVRGCHFDMTESPYSTVGAGGHPSEGLYGQGVTLTPNQGAIAGAVVEENWINRGKHGVVGSGVPSFPLSATVRNNRFGPDFVSADVTGTGVVAPRPVIFPANEWNLIDGLRTTTGLDDSQGNTNYDGSPVMIWRETP